MFAHDRDLLAADPSLFRDIGWNSQRLMKGTGSISGTTLTLGAYDVDFAAAGIDAGHVVVVDGIAYEVVARLTATTATISCTRADPDGPVLPPSPVTGKPVQVNTFGPQIRDTHRQVLGAFGIEPGSPVDGVGEGSILNTDDLREVEALGALNLIYTAAAAPTTADARGRSGSRWLGRASIFRDLYAAALSRAIARIDLDNDGKPDATRHANVIQLIRE